VPALARRLQDDVAGVRPADDLVDQPLRDLEVRGRPDVESAEQVRVVGVRGRVRARLARRSRGSRDRAGRVRFGRGRRAVVDPDGRLRVPVAVVSHEESNGAWGGSERE
jgi:hypothetical protein